MKIAVCLKFVPVDPDKSIEKSSGRIIRSQDNCDMGLLDVYALETALYIKKTLGGTVDAYTMGVPAAGGMLRKAYSLGAVGLYLLTDSRFAGADTYATARTLAAGLKGGYDLILCGDKSFDGETGQVPAELSYCLGCAYGSGVCELTDISPRRLTCRCIRPAGYELMELPIPAVISVCAGISGIGHPVLPSLDRLGTVGSAEIRLLDAEAIGLSADQVGLAGSLTVTERVSVPDWSRRCQRTDDLERGISMVREVLHG